MLEITIEHGELWDENNLVFLPSQKQTLQLVHSLVSISKWEAKWHKAFLGKEDKTTEEMIDYIRCMTLTKNVDPDIYNYLSTKNIEEIEAYIDNPMTATIVPQKNPSGAAKEITTSELIYYWMIAMNIPVEFEKWHLNRLITLIGLCDTRNTPPKKLSGKEIMSRNAALNAARRKKLNSTG